MCQTIGHTDHENEGVLSVTGTNLPLTICPDRPRPQEALASAFVSGIPIVFPLNSVEVKEDWVWSRVSLVVLLLEQCDPFDEVHHKIVGHVILDVMPCMRLRMDNKRYFRNR